MTGCVFCRNARARARHRAAKHLGPAQPLSAFGVVDISGSIPAFSTLFAALFSTIGSTSVDVEAVSGADCPGVSLALSAETVSPSALFCFGFLRFFFFLGSVFGGSIRTARAANGLSGSGFLGFDLWREADLRPRVSSGFLLRPSFLSDGPRSAGRSPHPSLR